MESVNPAIFILSAAVVFVLWWCFIVYLLSFAGGWRKLAIVYGLPGHSPGACFSFQAGRIGVVSYNGALTLTVSPEGIVFSVLPVFRPGHSPFMIPWRDIAITGTGFWGFVKFRAGMAGKDLMLKKKFFFRAWQHLPSPIQQQLRERAGIHSN